MRFILYAKTDNKAGRAVQKIVIPLIPENKLELYETIEAFSAAIRHCSLSDSIAILVATTPWELEALLNLRSILWDIRLILILPDRKKETISYGHKFFPRFMGYADGNMSDVVAVLRNFMNCKKRASHALQARRLAELKDGSL